MTWVKVCGLRTEGDVAAAVDAGADAVGFVLAGNSPRRVDQSQVRTLHPGSAVVSVIVTVDYSPTQLMAAVEATGVSAVQPHGHHQPEAARLARSEGLFVLYPVPVRGPVDIASIDEELIPLLDTYEPGRHGGTGQRFAWELIGNPARDIVLAGGLDPRNVGDAIQRVGPWGVDASSGLESAPGVKDSGKIREFIEKAKQS